MQGTWDVVACSLGRRSLLDDPTQVKINGTCFEFVVLGKMRSVWTLELDPRATPRRIDRVPAGGGAVLMGLYRFEGGLLILSYSQSSGRPTGFDPDPRCLLMTLRRAGR
jgi:uncharacterized protein (TIGR03067 family)